LFSWTESLQQQNFATMLQPKI